MSRPLTTAIIAMSEILRRQLDRIEIRAKDEDKRMIEFVASTSTPDSYGTVLPVDKWSLDRYAKNGVVGYQHDLYYSDDPDNVIGRGEAFVDGEALVIRIYFEPADINEKADKIYRKVLFGSLNSVSVGFTRTAPGHWGVEADGEDPDLYYYNGQELLEVSVVNIPANSDAVKRGMAEERKALEQERGAAVTTDKTSEGASSSDEAYIRLTLARAKRQLA